MTATTQRSPLLSRPRWRKVVADLWENRMRTFLVVASIAVGVFAMGTIISAFNIMAEDISVDYAASNPANIQIWTDPFDDDFAKSIERIPGVNSAEGRHTFTLRVSRDGGQNWENLSVIAVDDFANSEIFKLTPIAGTPNAQRREMMIEELALRTMPFELGQTLSVQLPDSTVREMPLVGFVSDQSVVGSPDSLATGYISMDTLSWLGRPSNYNRLYVTVSGNSNDDATIKAVSDEVRDKIERQNRNVYRTVLNRTNEHPMTTTVLAILGVLGAMGGLMLVLGSSLIANTLNALLSQHLRQIGVMKLIGARSLQILGMYVVLIVAFGLIALAVSIPLASSAGYSFAEFLANEMKIQLQGFRIIPLAIVVQVVLAIFVPLLAGFLPVIKGSRTTVEKAISEAQAGEMGASESWLDRLGEQLTWVSRPILISVRNTFRRKGRLALTLFTLTMAGAIFIGVFNVRASLDGFIDDIANLFIADVNVDFDRPYRLTQIEQAVSQVDGVVGVEGWLVGNGEFLQPDDTVDETITLIGAPGATELVRPKIVSGRWMQAGDWNALILPDTIYETYPDLQIGDSLSMSIANKRTEEWEVIGIFSFPAAGDEPLLGYMTYEKLSNTLNLPDQATTYRLVGSQHDFPYQQALSQRVDVSLRAQGFGITGVDAGRTIVEQAAESIGILVVFFLIMAILTALVGSIGLAGTMSMNVLDRTREIGVMRAIGAQDLEIIKTVLIEGLFIGAISWGLGAILSFPISWALLRVISLALINSPMDLVFSFNGFVLWLVVVLMLATLASILPARSAARLTIREVLAYE